MQEHAVLEQAVRGQQMKPRVCTPHSHAEALCHVLDAGCAQTAYPSHDFPISIGLHGNLRLSKKSVRPLDPTGALERDRSGESWIRRCDRTGLACR
jgi:hypothetical protein